MKIALGVLFNKYNELADFIINTNSMNEPNRASVILRYDLNIMCIACTEFTSAREKIISRYAVTDDKGKRVIPTDKIKIAEAELAPIEEIELDLPILFVSVADLVGAMPQTSDIDQDSVPINSIIWFTKEYQEFSDNKDVEIINKTIKEKISLLKEV